MPVYEYHCDANGETIEVVHSMKANLSIWGEVCYVAQIPLGDTDPSAPVRRVLSSPPAGHVPVGNSTLKEKGFTKLVRRDDGVYENVTATGDEARYMKRGDASTLPHLKKKIGD
jgi:hypothetical protein